MPHSIAKKLFRKAFPNFDRKLTRTFTMPITRSLVSVPTGQSGEKQASYIREHLLIGRNSQFDTLSMSPDDLMDIAYIEYQALGLLLWAIAVVSDHPLLAHYCSFNCSITLGLSSFRSPSLRPTCLPHGGRETSSRLNSCDR